MKSSTQYNPLSRRLNTSVPKALATIWLLLVTLLVILALQKEIQFDSSLMTLLPKENQSTDNDNLQIAPVTLLKKANEQIAKGFSNRHLLLLSSEDNALLRQAVAKVASRLEALPAIRNVTWYISDEELKKSQLELFNYRFVLLEDKLRQQLENGNGETIRQKALLKLFSPVSVRVGSLPEDPFGLFSEKLLHQNQDLNLSLDRQLLRIHPLADSSSTAKTIYLIMLDFNGDAFSLATQQQILPIIEQQKRELRIQGIELRQSGLLRHAAAGAEQASSEISTIGAGSLAGILLLLWLVFRSTRPAIAVLLPMSIALLTASAVTGLYFGSIHLITLAFGAGLIGVSIDYSLHYMCEYRWFKATREPRLHSSNSVKGIEKGINVLYTIWPGLLLGVFSSVAAYGAMAIPPFPGLRQMALFSVTGLCAAWLSVVLLLPILSSWLFPRHCTNTLSSDNSASHFYRLQRKARSLLKTKDVIARFIIVLIILFISGSSLYAFLQAKFEDNVRLLQTSPAELLEEETLVRQLLGGYSSSRFLLIHCKTWEQCLQQEETLQPELIRLQEKGVFQKFQAVSQQLPSLSRQKQNSILIQQLYKNELDALFDQLKLTESQKYIAETYLQQDIRLLHPEHWLTLDSSKGLRGLLLQDEVTNSGETQYASMIRFSGLTHQPDELESLQHITKQYPAVKFVDRVATISELMALYRSKIINWLLWAYAVVFGVLFWRYRSKALTVIAPPLLASLLTLAAVSQIEHGINLFHIMALILVLGIGLDMSIFVQESKGAPQTWLAVSLSCYTSLLAFGLLTLSATPVLHHFGIVVLIGLVLTWLLAFLFLDNSVTENFDDNTIGNH